MNRDDELERFKSDINLIEYATSQGYALDKKESSKASKVMRSGDDKIIIATDSDGHGIYFSVHDDADNGSVIDFVQKRKGLTLGHVRKELRPWTGGSSSYRPVSVSMQREKPVHSSADRQRVLAVWMKMQPTGGRHVYLETERGISLAILADERFAGAIRQDGQKNAVFPHYDDLGISGYELKNHEFTGFATGGKKAVWHSSNIDTAAHIVIVESAIDALSHAQLFGGDAAYMSTGGTPSEYQLAAVQQQIETASARGGVIVIATDNDESGRALAGKIRGLIPEGTAVEVQVPRCKDWNEDLLEPDDLPIDLEDDVPAPVFKMPRPY